MLILGQRNDDSLARDFDWFASSERFEISPASIWVPDEDETLRRRRVPAPDPSIVEEESAGDEWNLQEISPHVSVRDEDSFAKPVALPQITPHVSVRDEDSFAKPSALPQISPHVSVRDEDSFAKPGALPEITPHVSVRDEDSFAKPGVLPEINPHVSIRDEDSFAKPCALPEISPQVSILDESYATGDPSPQFTSGICGVDESKIQPGEPSFMTVSLDGQNEKRFVQEYIELGPSRPPELESSRPMELEPSRPAELKSSLPIILESKTAPAVEPSRPSVVPKVRVLDESQVLPGEASFATAIPSGPSAPHSHSPLEEFLAKTNLDLRTFGLATLLFISIIGVSALVILEATTGFFSSQNVASATANQTTHTAESAVPQSKLLSAAKPIEPVVASKLSKQEIQSMAPPHGYSKFPGEVTKPMSPKESTHDLSPKAHSNDVRAEKAEKKSAGKPAKVSESVAKNSTSPQKKLEVKRSTSKDTARKSVSASAKDKSVTKPKMEVKVPSVSNGAQRPRRVTPHRTSVGGQ